MYSFDKKIKERKNQINTRIMKFPLVILKLISKIAKKSVPMILFLFESNFFFLIPNKCLKIFILAYTHILFYPEILLIIIGNIINV